MSKRRVKSVLVLVATFVAHVLAIFTHLIRK
jgi:hypothetical protein